MQLIRGSSMLPSSTANQTVTWNSSELKGGLTPMTLLPVSFTEETADKCPVSSQATGHPVKQLLKLDLFVSNKLP